MVSVRIGTVERKLDEASKSWINQEINRRRAEGENVCVIVQIQEPGIDLSMATPSCARNGGGGRHANPRELDVIALWEKRHLNRMDFESGNLVAFLEQLGHLL